MKRGVLSALIVLAAAGCKDDALDRPTPAASASSGPAALSPELRAKVLAKVGDRKITLGEYAATLERMDRFERLRYQSADRRRALLDEIVKVELLAEEAKRRGLDKKPEIKQRIRQILRDEVLKMTRAKLPPPGEIPEREVRKYYDEHRDDFREPERRRVAHIVVADKKKAEEVLKKALKATPMQWGRLVQEHSLTKPPKPSPTAPLELAGDLGIVGKPGAKRGENPKVPSPLREAVFKVEKVGNVLDQVVEHDGKFHIVRMTGKTAARDRAYREAERTIRVAILQERIREAEKKLEAELRKKYPVKIDDAALKTVDVPSAGKGAAPPPAPKK